MASLSSKLEINSDIKVKDSLLTFLMDRINTNLEAYKDIPIVNIIFSYGIREGKITPFLGIKKPDLKHHIFYRNKLPLGIKPSDYGKILYSHDNNFTIAIDNKVFISLTQERKEDHDFNIIKYYKNNLLAFSWEDKIIDDNKFIRYIGKTIIHYDNGNITKYKVQKKTSGMTNKLIPKNNQVTNKLITMDFKTIIIDNKHVPYLLC
jgi:hypothetical protein